jgi:AcrR family transcriptional regulator
MGAKMVMSIIKRDQIIACSMAKFNRYGIRRVTMDEIAREMRISKKTLYLQFDSKEALVRACVEKVAFTVLPAILKQLTSKKAVDKRLLGSFKKLAKLPQLITREFIMDMRTEFPQIFEEIDQRRKQVAALYEGLLKQGIADGVIQPTIDPKVYVAIMLAVMENVMVPEAFFREGFSTRDVVRTLITIMSHGLFVHDPDLNIKELVP